MDRLDATRGRRTIARPGTGERPVGPPDHSPGRNPGAKRHTPHQTGPRARMDVPPRPYSTASGTRPPPGFRPGLWYTGPTAQPGTGERPVGAPDHSQGRNPWAAKPWATKPLGGETPASADAPEASDSVKTRRRRPRGLGKCENTPLNVSEASESSKTRR